ncbi:MAG: sugar nucleotide-binding protein [Alphaproteobacteria bacterium]|nr:sugar nucleotide-binding protein [Alphaproteobacteria bacterium]
MRVLVLGRDGRVGRALARRLPDGVDATFLGREADRDAPDVLRERVGSVGMDVLVDVAGATDVEAAERAPGVAHRRNAVATGVLAELAARRGVAYLTVSTAYVFDGSGDAPWLPDAPTSPLNVYGHSKLAAEAAVRDAGGTHLVLRTCAVIDPDGRDFLGAVRSRRGPVEVVADQVVGPTPADALADALWRLAAVLRDTPGLSGTHHLTGWPDVSYAGLARHALGDGRVVEVRSADRAGARRPLNARLDGSSLLSTFGIPRPDWRDAVPRI